MRALRPWPILIAIVLGMLLHLATMDLFLGGPIFHPYAWMSILTGIGCGVVVAAKQLWSERQRAHTTG
jgi:hypothetical protein